MFNILWPIINLNNLYDETEYNSVLILIFNFHCCKLESLMYLMIFLFSGLDLSS